MTSFLILGNAHLGIELFGALVFFIAAALFLETSLLKRDFFSIARCVGFMLLSVRQVIHAVGGESSNLLVVSFVLYCAGLLLVLAGYTEKLPPEPSQAALALPVFNVSSSYDVIPSVILALITFALARRYFASIDRLVRWLLVGFALFTIASIISVVSSGAPFGTLWIVENMVRLAAFIALSVWIWRFLSLRIREETLLIFISTSLFITLLITTTFSVFLLRSLEVQTLRELSSGSRLFGLYVDNLKGRALSASEVVAGDPDFIAAAAAHDISALERMSLSLSEKTNVQFITLAAENGSVFFKSAFPVLQGENILSQSIGSEALQGHRIAATVDAAGAEGLSIRAAAPLVSRGKIIGAVITGYRLDKKFAEDFKEVGGFETSVFSGRDIVASSVFGPHTLEKAVPDEFVGTTNIAGGDVIGNFFSIKNYDGRNVATIALTTTPSALFGNVQTTNRLTLFVVMFIVLGLVIPLYRFSVFLATY